MKKKKTASINEVIILRRQVANRENLIDNIQTEMSLLDALILKDDNLVNALQRDLDELKSEYADMVRVAYKNRSNYKNMLFLLSARDFNQAFQRLNYIQQYNKYRQRQADLIEETKEVLERRIDRYLSRKEEKKLLLLEQEEQKGLYQSAREREQKVLNALAQDERKLKKALAAKKKARAKLDGEIQAIIRAEIARAKAEARAKGEKHKGTSLLNTEERLRLNEGFQGNQGKLPWPVDRGFIAEHYGENAHPVLKNVKTFNNGIDIATDENEIVKAIFDGEVTGVISIPGMQNTVIIRHGNYLSVYAHLEKVNVKLGEIVAARQPIGNVHTDQNAGKTEIHFEVWKGTTKLNPENWLSR